MAVFQVTLFGVLQTLHGQRVMNVEAEVPVTVLSLQKTLISQLGGCEYPVALAENNRLLKANDMLETGRPLMALPPVCGG